MPLALLLAVALALAPAAPAAAQQLTYQQDAAHSGQATVPGLDPPFRRRWVATLGQDMSYPVIVGGRVFVAVRNPDTGPYGTRVVALAAGDGRLLWERPLSHTYYWSGLAYSHDTLFALTYDGVLHALDPATGAVRWSKDVPGGSASSEPTPAGDGLYVFADGALTKLDPATGNQRWTTEVSCCGSSHTSPTVADGRVFIGQACGETRGFDAATGRQLWRYEEGCHGGGGKTVGYWNGRVFAREFHREPAVLDAGSGALLGRWGGGLLPAFAGDMGFFGAAGGALVAAAMPSGPGRWSYPGLLAPPLVVNGRVVAGTQSGVVALDAGSGAVQWRDAEVLAATPDEHNVSSPVAGLGAGDGIFAVPTDSGLLVAYEHGTAPSVPVPGSSGLAPTVPGAPPPAATTGGPVLQISLKRRRVFLGERTRLLGRLSGSGVLAGRVVRLQVDEHPYDGRWRTAARARTLADGTFGFLVRPRRNTMVRVVLADDPAVAAVPQQLFAEFPYRVRERRRAGTVTITLYAFPRAQIRRRPLYAYWTVGRTRPWTRVTRTRWQVKTRRYVRATIRFPRDRLRRRGARWAVCLPERVPDGIGRPSEFERRCGARTIPRGLG